MKTAFLFKNMAQMEQTQVQDYFEKKLPKLEKLLSHFAEDAVTLQVKSEKFDKHSAFEVEYVLQLPSQTLTATEASHAITKAVDLATDRLTMQLKKKVISSHRTHRGLKAKISLKRQELVLEV